MVNDRHRKDAKIGLDHGRINDEYQALETIARYPVACLAEQKVSFNQSFDNSQGYLLDFLGLVFD